MAQVEIAAADDIADLVDPDPNNPCAATNPWQLPRGCHCAYVIQLGVNDNTWVGNGGDDHNATVAFAINIINDIT